MTSARIIEIFKGVGKIIKLSDLGVADASGVKAQLVATQQQFGTQAASGSDLYDDYTQVVGPLQERMKPTVAALDRIPAVAKASVEAYLRTIAPEMNLSASASTTAILDALKARMQTATQTIAPSGGQFYRYFQTNFGYAALPTNVSPNIPDSWITISIV